MKGFFRWIVANSLIANLLTACILLAGAAAYLSMPREYLPPVNLKWLMVFLPYPGVSAADVEQVVVRPVEEELEKIDHVRQFNSYSTEGHAELSLQFEEISEEEFERQCQEVRQAIDRVPLPEETLDPFYFEIKSSNFIPLVQLAVVGDERISYRQLRELAKDLADRVDDFWEVDQVTLYDDREREVHVQVDPARVRELGLTLDDIRRAILSQNLDRPAGTLELGRDEYLVRSVDQYRSLDDLRATVVRADPLGNHVRLDQVAAVQDTYAREAGRSRLDGHRCVTMGVSKQEAGSSVHLIGEIRSLMGEVSQTLPPGVRIELVNDTAARVASSLTNLQNNALLGGAVVVLLLWLFLGLRNGALAALGIPVSFALAFVLLKHSGTTLNENALFGLVLVLGMVVDDAIIVIENVYRYMQAGVERLQAVVDGTREVLAPVISSTLTTIAAFIPLVLLPGTIGEFLKVVPIVISLTLVASLLECFLILPSHIADFGNPAGQRSLLEGAMERMARRYQGLLRVLLPSWRRYAIAVGVPLLILVTAAVVFPRLRQELYSTDPQSYFAVWLTLPEGTALDETDRHTRLLEAAVRRLPEADRARIERILVNVGIQNTESRAFIRPNFAELIVDVADGPEMKATLERMTGLVRQEVRNLGYSQEQVRAKIIESGPPRDMPVEAKIQGDDFAVLEEIAGRLKAQLAADPGLVNVGDDYTAGKGELTFTLDRTEAQRLGLTAADVSAALQGALRGAPAGIYRDTDEELAIQVRYEPGWFTTGERLADIEVRTPAGDFVRLGSVARLERGVGYSEIRRRDFKRTVTVFAEEHPDSLGSGARASRRLEELYNRQLAAAYPGYRLIFGGQFQEFAQAFDNLALLFGLGAMCIFFVLVVEFRSLVQPFIILTTIPFALAGAMVGLVVNGYPLSITAIYGMVGLSGVVVNDSIVLISFVNDTRRQGMPLYDAILDGGAKRLRAIILTTITTVGGVLPMAMGLTGRSEVWSPLATLIAYGLSTATTLMLIVIPCLYHVAEDLRALFQRHLGARLERALRHGSA